MATFSFEEFNRIDMVDFLAYIGIHPIYFTGKHYFFRSPFLTERNTSLKIDRWKNRWTDATTTTESTLLDFGIRFYGCTIRELTEILSRGGLSKRHSAAAPTPFVLRSTRIHSPSLLRRLRQDRIAVEISRRYCLETEFTFGIRPLIGLSFPNQFGGMVLWHSDDYYLIPPNSYSLINHNGRNIAVFERFIQMLHLVSILDRYALPAIDLLVLHSPTHFTECQSLIAGYEYKHLFLSTRPPAPLCHLLDNSDESYIDHRPLYRGYSDLRDWILHFGLRSKRSVSSIQNPCHATNSQ